MFFTLVWILDPRRTKFRIMISPNSFSKDLDPRVFIIIDFVLLSHDFYIYI
jgi:hypothetical protein